MKNNPTIVAVIIFIISISLAFYITFKEQESKVKKNDVEIFTIKSPVEVPPQFIFNENISFMRFIMNSFTKEIKNKRLFLHNLVDSYEIEISDFWREVLNYFEIIEYYKGYPEAFIRRLIFMPTFTGNKDYLGDEIDDDKPKIYPDHDYRSIRYRVSLVPNTINNIKELIDYFYFRIVSALSLGITSTN